MNINYSTNEKGSSMIVVLGLLMMMTVMGLMAVSTSQTDIELSFNQVHSEKSFYIAEAGAKRAIAEIRVDKTWGDGFDEEEFNGGTYTVQVEDSSTNAALFDTIIVTSYALMEAAQAEVEITLVPELFHPFNYAMFGKDSMSIKNSMETDSYNSDSGSYAATADTLQGSIGSNGIITVNNGAVIGGDVVTSLAGGADVNAGATVTGDISDNIPEQIPMDIPQSEYDWAEANNDAVTGISGTATYNTTNNSLIATGDFVITEGIYFFSSIVLKNSANLIIPPGDDVTIYVTGNIELKQSAAVNDGGSPTSLLIYSQGDFVLKNSGDFYGTFYNPNGVADLRNSGEFYGSVVSSYTIGHNSSKFHYDRSLSDKFGKETGKILMVAWKEN